jgi:hypothetical protein
MEERLIHQPIGDELLIFDNQSKECHLLGPLAKAVLENRPWSEQETSWSPEQVFEGRAVTQTELAEKGLMDYPKVPLTRGQFLKRWGSVVMLPVISSLTMPEPAAAASGVSCTCNFSLPLSNPDCVSCGGSVFVSAGSGTNCSNVDGCPAQCGGLGLIFRGLARNAGGILVCCCG